MVQLAKTIGIQGTSNYLAGQGGTIEGQVTIETGEGVTFGVLPFTVEYYKDVS